MTLVEVMHAAVLFIILGLALLLCTSAFSRMSKKFSSDITLTNEARVVLGKMVWGNALPGEGVGRHGLWAANGVTLVGTTRVNYTDTAGATRTFRLNGQNIEFVDRTGTTRQLYDPNGAAAPDPGTYSTDLAFSNSGNVVQIDLILGRNVRGKWNYASASTQVALRN